jgi:hypothetical protein
MTGCWVRISGVARMTCVGRAVGMAAVGAAAVSNGVAAEPGRLQAETSAIRSRNRIPIRTLKRLNLVLRDIASSFELQKFTSAEVYFCSLPSSDAQGESEVPRQFFYCELKWGILYY